MLIQYAYLKQRSQFGKQCFFEETDAIVEENLLPNPRLMRNYVQRSHCDRGVQKSAQFALHEMQTTSKVTKESGMFHSEGGWPREISARDEEATHRFRRRVEKDEYWPTKMKKLTGPMERYVLENNAINIYQHYFDDIVPTALVLPRTVRTSNVYVDPQPIVRPVIHLSWSSGGHNRLAGAYSFMESETQLPDVNLHSYIWDIENPNAPMIRLISSSSLMTIEFNPRDPSMLISGLMSGQVCNWDIRIGNRPVQTSHLQFSHRNSANETLWLTSKTNTEFFSASIDGTIMWWDIRKLRQPTDLLVMDLDDPLRADTVKAIGVACLHFDPSMGSKFMAGLENGTVVNVNRKAANKADMLAMRFNCHLGPVVAIERNPFISKNFLTVGDCITKIWADDTREASLLVTRQQNADLSGGCWSRARHSVFFTINVTGLLEVYDILNGVDSPVATFRVCDQRLTAIAPHENGQLLAVGSRDGKIYLLECTEGYTPLSNKADKAQLNAYFEMCSRFEKAVDARLREIRLLQASVPEDTVADSRKPMSVTKNRYSKERHDRTLVKEKSNSRKKSRPRRMYKEDSFFADDAELMESEAEYFRTVEKEFTSYTELQDRDIEQQIVQETSRKRKKRAYSKVKEEIVMKQPPKPVRKERIRTTKPPMEVAAKDARVIEEKETMETPFAEARETKAEEKILGKVCTVKVCKPRICCIDMEEELRAELRARVASKERSSRGVTPSPWLSKLRDLVQRLPKRSAVWKRRLPLEGESLANVLASEAEQARREVHVWQRKAVPRRRDSRRWPRTVPRIARKDPEVREKNESGDDESPVGDEMSDFQQSAGTGLGREHDSRTSTAARGKAKQLPHPEKCVQEDDLHSALTAIARANLDDTTGMTNEEMITTATVVSTQRK